MRKSPNKIAQRKFEIDDKGRIIETMEFPKFMMVHTLDDIKEFQEMLNKLNIPSLIRERNEKWAKIDAYIGKV